MAVSLANVKSRIPRDIIATETTNPTRIAARLFGVNSIAGHRLGMQPVPLPVKMDQKLRVNTRPTIPNRMASPPPVAATSYRLQEIGSSTPPTSGAVVCAAALSEGIDMAGKDSLP